MLNDSIMEIFHIPHPELMNLEETKKDSVYKRYSKERILDPNLPFFSFIHNFNILIYLF